MVEAAHMASICDDTQDISTISWPLLVQETASDTSLSNLLQQIEHGTTTADSRDPDLAPFGPIRDSIYAHEGVLLYQDRVIVPTSLRPRVLQHLHAAHQGTSSMEQRARTIIYWPGMARDIRAIRERCSDCNGNAPSQAATPPLPSPPPSTPFEAVFADFFDYGGHHYLVAGDRLSGWVEVFGSKAGTTLAGAAGLTRHLRSLFATFGVPEELSSEGGPEFTAGVTQDFLRAWGVRHRVSSAHFPQSNGRAEVAVKTAKRLLMSNTGPTGSLDHDRFLRAMLQLRNTPDPDCNVLPAQIIFGRPLRDTLSFVNRLEKFSNPHVRPLWREAWAAKEDALRSRITRTAETLKEHSRPLRPLAVGERVFLQNQQGRNPNKWDRSGVVVESPGHDQYRVKVDGSGLLTLRNRRFLRAYTPASSDIKPPPAVATPPHQPCHTSEQRQRSQRPPALSPQRTPTTTTPPSELGSPEKSPFADSDPVGPAAPARHPHYSPAESVCAPLPNEEPSVSPPQQEKAAALPTSMPRTPTAKTLRA
ncbi:uncharacterized protein K02A2.6-like [Nematostella vectensis]|uniref:uncharacterized protein K02A2.6-like n=1 Tax=Nematostella vectensis TaxID=45351 RepID=UPI0020777B5D|nr:uncharacterized protein K02A2.6-like [Nematostella vectensis]